MQRRVSKPTDLTRQNTAFEYDTDGALDESGDKLSVWKNNGVEKASIDKDGNMELAGSLTADNLVNNASHYIVAAGAFTTVGGDADESITIAECLNTDLIFCQLSQKGATPRTLLTALAGNGSAALVFSGDPSNDHIVSYQVVRASA